MWFLQNDIIVKGDDGLHETSAEARGHYQGKNLFIDRRVSAVTFFFHLYGAMYVWNAICKPELERKKQDEETVIQFTACYISSVKNHMLIIEAH